MDFNKTVRKMKCFNGLHIDREVEFDEIYHLYYPRLILFAVKLTGNREESEEIIQDVFVRFWLKEGSLNIKFSIKAYLFRSVHNACLDYLKKEKVQQKNNNTIFSFFHETIEFSDPILQEELENAIHKSIEELPDQCKNVFLLHREKELTYREIAEHLNISVKTVETHIFRAVKSLRKSLAVYLPQIFL